MSNWVLYGAYGYTGQLIIEEALARGHRPFLSGRNAAKLEPIAEKFGLPWQAVDLSDSVALDALLAGAELVLHSAGPFVHTSKPMIEACLRTKTHYLDITGEIPVFEQSFGYAEQAETAGIVLISGVGFDVIPTDCLAAYVAAQVENPTELEIAFVGLGGVSAGTTKSMIEMMPKGNRVRRNGRLQTIPFGKGSKRVRFQDKTRTVVPIPWGDVATAFRTTSIPNITTYSNVPSPPPFLSPLVSTLFSVGPVREAAKWVVGQTMWGPDENARQRGKTHVWARVANENGDEAEAWLTSLEGYHFTAKGSLLCVEQTLDGNLSGATTPALAFGPDLVLAVPGTKRFDSILD